MKDRIFGLRPVLEAIEAGKTIDKLMIQKGLQGDLYHELLDKATEYGIPMQQVPIQKLNRLTGKNHQGVFAFISPIDFYKIENVLPSIYEAGKNPLILILDRVSDVRNFGAIARTAECTGVDVIIIPEKGSASVNEDAIKTSAGALYQIPVCKVKSLKETIKFLQLSGISITCASEKTSDTIYDMDFSLPTAIVMGSEDDGVSNELIRISDNLAKLPMYGEIGSLNVSVACGAFLYEVIRQRL
ncbi:23S rRNA (guanosine(2251)-2'-O)-methyltransferase RlmB [Weeksellaceae bacterium KMM 9713]|uniref:23S rRNA (Guanosine(2251)-2'-O)-methyltransferase RlmB n=1 Tax=Profundicola chukchiensis TaxID=2961959 RepID=A0A9X4RWL2_9FLAO|nr:23S rRNA (guanosine(2251)-2'-O)-methyltransferase RlmB [Profundicola chukchiensis]MDG4945912.1 23S rRNA (guanosine(2251)-2'-O)-methyltransferase RlmB [Profundicola chukchiensis]MDG4951230.1 23S rRNA (guanosine(2251)-2'-O)-methyltransferase RlmB [Profundicola chukchiensis]